MFPFLLPHLSLYSLVSFIWENTETSNCLHIGKILVENVGKVVDTVWTTFTAIQGVEPRTRMCFAQRVEVVIRRIKNGKGD